MATKTFWHYDTAVGSYGKLDEGTAPTAANTLTKASGSVNSGTGLGEAEDQVVYGSTVTLVDGTLNSPGSPNGSNGLRTLNTLSGIFAAGTWALAIEQISNSIASSTYQFFWRLYKSVNADGSGATLLQNTTGSGSGACSGTIRTPSINITLGALTFADEYLFWTLAIDIATARTLATTITPTLRVGGTSIVTPNFSFIYNSSLSEAASATDLFTAQQVFNNFLAEPALTPWGLPGILWNTSTGVWGGSLLGSFSAVQIFACPLIETGNASDSLIGNTVYPNVLSETASPSDLYAPNLSITKTLAESGSATDILTCVDSMTVTLLESLLNYWGTPGILWGSTCGTWGGTTAVESLSTSQIFGINLITETVLSIDSYATSQVFVSALVESSNATDIYVPGLVIATALSELSSAIDSYVANLAMNTLLVESAIALWGSSGILWGSTTGVWGDNAVDSYSSTQVFACPMSELVVALDTLQASQIFIASLLELSNAVDIYIPNLVIGKTLLEAGGAVDSYLSIQVFSNFLFENGNAKDSLAFSVIGSTANLVPGTGLAVVIFGTVPIQDTLGVDLSSFPDLDPLGSLVQGMPALGQRLARRLTNPRGAWFWAPNECTDIRQYLNDVVTQELLNNIKNSVEREVLREEAVKTANADITFDILNMALAVTLSGVTKDGPFNFVFKITSSQLTILNS